MNDKDHDTKRFIINKLSTLERYDYLNTMKADDIYSLGLLQPLLEGYPFIPFTGSALRPFCLNHMVNDIIINHRQSIIEFGSGISTIIISRLIKKNRLNASFLSVEHNAEWVNVLEKILQRECLEDTVKILQAPLTHCALSIDNNQWFDVNLLNDHTNNKKFDMVIIDGPPAWEESKKTARYRAVPYIMKKLSDDFSIYLDDANRAGEESIIKLWEKEFNIEFTLPGSSLAFYYGGNTFYTEPSSYYQLF